MKFFNWLQSIISETSGSGSTTRVLMFILVLSAVIWSSVLLYDVHKHYMTIEQFDGYLTSIGQYLTITAGPLYATNKIADCYNNKISNKSNGNGQ